MILGPIVEVYGVPAALLAFLAYQVYENRLGTIKSLRDDVETIGVVIVRLAQDVDGVDEDAVRDAIFEDDDTVLSDFDDDGDDGNGGSHHTPIRPRGGD